MHLKEVHRMFGGSFKAVSRKFQGVSWKFNDCYGNFKGVSKQSRDVLRKFYGCFRKIPRVFQECFK